MTTLMIGCGRMGGAMARAWTARHRVLAYDPGATLPYGVERIDDLAQAAGIKDLIVVLAVKPQAAPAILPLLAPLAREGALFLSVMAGVTLAGLGEGLGGHDRIVRTMPNTPAAIGAGITAAFAADGADAQDRARVTSLLETTGQVVWLESEADFDAVTAVSGSGPAYFFRFAEALARAGEAAGLSRDLAMALARATFTGSAALAAQQPEALARLRAHVTSPGGTTAAGLACFEVDSALDDLVDRVVTAAAARSQELAERA